jgi:7 transmembrane sweet-taste receptor of 3 GCPR/Periplasmic binding protein domain
MEGSKKYRFAVVPKEAINPFYDAVKEGCMDASSLLSDVECIYIGPDSVDADAQAKIIRSLLKNETINGISMAVIEETIANELADEALDAKIPFITFDSDAPSSKRLAYVGTDNFEFGQSLAKVLLQINPKGGIYGIIDAAPPNLQLRAEGIRYRLQHTRWTESAASPKDCLDSIPLSIQHMYDYASLTDEPINAIVPVGGWPMRNETGWKEFVDAYRNLTLDVADTDPNQLDLLSKAYVDGLVGQVPYQMGSKSIQMLLEISTGKPIMEKIATTSLVEVVRIPLSLPRVDVNDNQLESLVVVGYTAVALVYLLTIAFMIFTGWKRNMRVIKASQPLFLYIILFGVLIMISSIIPLSIDDSAGSPAEYVNAACMTFPWLLTLGFATTFSALLSKTWRINKIFQTSLRFTRKEVNSWDVLFPVIILLGANILVLSLWTAFAPLQFSRQPHPGTDAWNRVISTYGMCSSPNALPYAVTIVILNFMLLLIANYQAFRARDIQSEFSESKYIAIVMGSMLQIAVIGIPIVFLVYDEPRVVYLVISLAIFSICLSILLFIFIPKIYFVRLYSRTPEELGSLRQSTIGVPTTHFYEDKRTRVSIAKGHSSLRHSSKSALNDSSAYDETKVRGSGNSRSLSSSQELKYQPSANFEKEASEIEAGGEE